MRSFPRKNARFKKSSHKTSDAERTRARLLYLTQSGGHQVSSTRKGDPAPQFLTKLRLGTPSFASIGLPTKASSRTAERQKRSILQGLASPWDTIPANAQDATKQCGAETTEREASLGIKRVRKHNFGKGTRQNSDSDSQVYTQPTQGHNSNTTERQEQGRNKWLWAQRHATSSSRHSDITKPQHGTANARQHSGYNNSSIRTFYTAEILQPANGCCKEEARATTLCMAWHAQQEASRCTTIPTDTSWRGHSASTTSIAAGDVAMQVQYKQGQTAKDR